LAGFKVKTSPGSNNYFATGGFNVVVQVLDANDNVLASASGSFFAPGSYCFQASSVELKPGIMVKYK
jgi:hypothetical protein